MPNIPDIFINNAKEITISGSGEAFFSEHSRLLIKKLTKTKQSYFYTIQMTVNRLKSFTEIYSAIKDELNKENCDNR